MTEFSQFEKDLIREMQGDIPLERNPFDVIAKKIGSTGKEVIDTLNKFKEEGKLRSVRAVLYHRNSGYLMNGMFIFSVPEDLEDEIGEKLAALPQVSHCYRRAFSGDLPYNMYGMVHGKSKDEVEGIVDEFVKDNGIKEYDILYSIEELKKTSSKFY